MGTITFIEYDGTEHKVDIEPGQSLMRTAVNNNVPGIDGDCGGECACGTCHVILEGDWIKIAGSANSEELQMLDMTPERAENSRLACQITTSEDMDGMVARMPEFQM
ncbi:2Fe-2S iron-sulfur cluster-binding protein [Algiphilus sp. W345]|uniref:2Fe-2S iron-sulfur cluster-binding protein n=1 Tax=Banduia mediterranea TaxID=3075609 RepID=A0ABU2WJ36_9GAMM|nr:2Fe-2S iron-sulfur cluster-binding protein [Algiphilus sp. W345]MDT0497575.1 2Fe-2S iron-sulfur cluster-binding protein [Algiphilus sp. W345]